MQVSHLVYATLLAAVLACLAEAQTLAAATANATGPEGEPASANTDGNDSTVSPETPGTPPGKSIMILFAALVAAPGSPAYVDNHALQCQ